MEEEKRLEDCMVCEQGLEYLTQAALLSASIAVKKKKDIFSVQKGIMKVH